MSSKDKELSHLKMKLNDEVGVLKNELKQYKIKKDGLRTIETCLRVLSRAQLLSPPPPPPLPSSPSSLLDYRAPLAELKTDISDKSSEN